MFIDTRKRLIHAFMSIFSSMDLASSHAIPIETFCLTVCEIRYVKYWSTRGYLKQSLYFWLYLFFFQIEEVLDQASGLSETGSVVLVGDFNAEPHMEEVRIYCATCITGSATAFSFPSYKIYQWKSAVSSTVISSFYHDPVECIYSDTPDWWSLFFFFRSKWFRK